MGAHSTHLEGGPKWITVLWERVRLAAGEQGRSRRAARQQLAVWDGEGADQEMPVVMPNVEMRKPPYLPPQA